MKIVEAQQHHLEAIMEITNFYITNSYHIYHTRTRALEEYERWWNDQLENNHPVFSVINDEDRVVGYCTYNTFRPWDGYAHVKELALYLHPTEHGKGVGKAMLKMIVEAARNSSIEILVAGIDKENTASIKLHEKNGFKEVGEMPRVGKKNDSYRTLILLQKELT